MPLKILENKIKCKECGDVIVSNDFYEIKKCKCGKVGISGENKILCRIGEYKDYEDLTEVEFDGKKMLYKEAIN